MTKFTSSPATSSNKANNKSRSFKLAGSDTRESSDARRAERDAALAKNAEELGVKPSFKGILALVTSNVEGMPQQVQDIISAIVAKCQEIGYEPASDFSTRPFIYVPAGGVFFRPVLAGTKDTWVTVKPLLDKDGKQVFHNTLPLIASKNNFNWRAELRSNRDADSKIGMSIQERELQLRGYFYSAGSNGDYVTTLGINWDSIAFVKFCDANIADFDTANEAKKVLGEAFIKLMNLLRLMKYTDPSKTETNYINPLMLRAEGRYGIEGLLTKKDFVRFASWKEQDFIQSFTASITGEGDEAQAKLDTETYYAKEAFSSIWKKAYDLQKSSQASDSYASPAPATEFKGTKPRVK